MKNDQNENRPKWRQNEGKWRQNEPFFYKGSLFKVLYSLSWGRVNEGNEPFLACVVFFSLFWVLFTTLTFYLHYLHYYILKHYILRHKTMNLQLKLRFILENQHSFLHFYYGKKSIYTPKWGFLCLFKGVDC